MKKEMKSSRRRWRTPKNMKRGFGSSNSAWMRSTKRGSDSKRKPSNLRRRRLPPSRVSSARKLLCRVHRAKT